VAKVCGDGKRERTRAFTELQSHYLFRDRFGRPGKGNDKGKVEGLVKYARSNFLTPIPRAASFDDLNAMLEEMIWLMRFGGTSIWRANAVGVTPSLDSSSFRTSPGWTVRVSIAAPFIKISMPEMYAVR